MESLDEIRGRFLLVALLLGVVAVVALAACGGPSEGVAAVSGPSASATPRQGGTYNYPLLADPRPFDPGLVQFDYGTVGPSAILHQLYEGLVRWELQSDGTLKTVPCLAESWRANDDCSIWTFKLRHGVQFQAPVSREVRATDVVADLRYLADPASVKVIDSFVPQEEYQAGTELSGWLGDISGTNELGLARPSALGVKALDRYTVRFTLKHPYSEFPETLGHQAFWVWPNDYRRKVGAKAYAEHPVGTGPYQFLQRAYGRSLDLERNPSWWDTSGGPYIDRIHYRVYSSEGAMLLAFQQGLVDWARVTSGQLDELRALPQVTTGKWTAESGTLLGFYFIEANMRDPVVGGRRGLELRQALTSGCDRGAVIDVLKGEGIVSTGLVPPGISGSEQVRGPYDYDAARAGQLYEQAGSPTLELAYPTPFMEPVPEGILAGYAKSGISIRPRGMAQGPWWTLYGKGKLQLDTLGWYADYPSMDNFLYPAFHSDEPGNSTSYSNHEVDDLLDKARTTLDPEARQQLYAEVERLILVDAPIIPLYIPTESRLLDNRVLNVNFSSMSSVDLWRAWVK